MRKGTYVLVTALLREVVVDEVLPAVDLLAGLVLVLAGDLREHAVAEALRLVHHAARLLSAVRIGDGREVARAESDETRATHSKTTTYLESDEEKVCSS